MKPTNFPNRKKKKQQEAQKRQEEYDKLSLVEKVDRLNKKLGNDIGATKQRAKLAAEFLMGMKG
ncbi:MAG: hypothetical protein HY376_00575 [Candidatus Blackburnbacteria bacterium]|nr:hypothetical protein [Candidatus Blackburnbacteria bacterium]